MSTPEASHRTWRDPPPATPAVPPSVVLTSLNSVCIVLTFERFVKIRYCEHVSQNVKATILYFYLCNKQFRCQHKTFFLLPNGRVDNVAVWYADRNLVKVFLEFKVRLTWLYPLICDIDVWAYPEKAYGFHLTMASVCGMVIVLTAVLSRFFSIYNYIIMLYTMLQFFFWQKNWQHHRFVIEYVLNVCSIRLSCPIVSGFPPLISLLDFLYSFIKLIINCIQLFY